MASRRGPIYDVNTDIPSTRISFDVEAFDEAVRSHGVKLVHYQALRCPVGMTDMDDNRASHDDHEGCTNGFLYDKVGCVTALFIGNSKHKNPADIGFWDGSTVQVSTPRFYDNPDCKPFMVAPFDRFYLDEEIEVVAWQLFIHHASGRDRLKYPVKHIQSLVDARGERYAEGVDFDIKQEQIFWRDGRRPAVNFDADPDRGAVCAVRYTYRPWWYVGQVLHEVRVSQATGDDGTRSIQRMPQSLMLHREYVPLTRDQEEPGTGGIDSDALRTVLGPLNGGFGPR